MYNYLIYWNVLLNRLNYSANNNNESEIDEPSSVAGTSANASNTSKNKNLQKQKSRAIKTENFKEYLVAIESFTSEVWSLKDKIIMICKYKYLKNIKIWKIYIII